MPTVSRASPGSCSAPASPATRSRKSQCGWNGDAMGSRSCAAAAHGALAIECLKNGLHVLCEKPLALHTWDAIRMFDAARRHRRLLLVASKFRHVPAIARVREILLAGEMGDPVAFEVSFCSR